MSHQSSGGYYVLEWTYNVLYTVETTYQDGTVNVHTETRAFDGKCFSKANGNHHVATNQWAESVAIPRVSEHIQNSLTDFQSQQNADRINNWKSYDDGLYVKQNQQRPARRFYEPFNAGNLDRNVYWTGRRPHDGLELE